jgi:hypothetical protein
MRPPGFLSLRRDSNVSQSSIDSSSTPTTPAIPPLPNLNTNTNTSTNTNTNLDAPATQRNPPDPEQLKLEIADRKAKEGVKVHYFPKDKPVYSCRGCLVPIVSCAQDHKVQAPHLYAEKKVIVVGFAGRTGIQSFLWEERESLVRSRLLWAKDRSSVKG